MNIIEKKKRQMGQGGFTLIELLVVIAILAVLAGLAVIGIGAMRDNAEKQACKSDQDTLSTAAEAQLVASGGTATVTANDGSLLAADGKSLVKRPSKKATVSISGSTVSVGGC